VLEEQAQTLREREESERQRREQAERDLARLTSAGYFERRRILREIRQR